MESNDKLKYSIKSKIAISKFKEENMTVKNKFNFVSRKIAVVACACLFLTSGIVFAKDIKMFFNGILNHNKGIESAIENNYVEDVPSQPIKIDNIKTYIDSILMDDYKLCITLKFELPYEYNSSDVTKVQIPNLLIYDENENVLFNEFYEEIDYSFFNINNIKEIDRFWKFEYDISCLKENNNVYSLTYVIENENFPKSKNINIKFNKINLLNDNIIKNLPIEEKLKLSSIDSINMSTIDYIEGNWNFIYNLSEKIYERENYIYKIKNYNDYKFDFPKELIVSNTETKFEFSYNLNNIPANEDISIDKEAYIKTSDDILFTSSSELEYNKNIGHCYYTFELSKFNSKNEMQMIIPTNSGNDIVLELERID